MYHLLYNKTLIGQRFRPKLDFLHKEDISVGLSFASSNTDIFLTK